MTLSPAQVFLVLAAAVRATTNGTLDGWVAADEVAQHYGWSRTDQLRAQRMGALLAALERREIFESRREEWGKMWRPHRRIREALAL